MDVSIAIRRVASLFGFWVVLVLAQACAPAGGESAGPAANVSGRWTGQCYGCTVKAFTLILEQRGQEVIGSIKTDGAPTFGDDEKPILGGKVASTLLTFQARGSASELFVASLTVSGDGKSMSGRGNYRSTGFDLRFARDPGN
jgi:hypothetical protein